MSSGWIGVDLDGTLCEYHGWTKWCDFGAPIPAMVERVKGWLAAGKDVRVVTARVGLPLYMGNAPRFSKMKRQQCRMTQEWYSDHEMQLAIQRHLMPHVGSMLPVQCWKDLHMLELWDDRAVQVVCNTGRTLKEGHEAEISVMRGRAFKFDDDIGE